MTDITKVQTQRKRLLWIGDAGVPSGFARATHEILDVLQLHYDVTVLGMNYRGDPHDYPYPIYVAMANGDAYGVERIVWMCDTVQPDVIVIQNDGWNVQPYLEMLRGTNIDGTLMFPDHARIPVVAIVAVDGKNFQGKWLKGVAHAIFWTQFGLDEARAGGYVGPASVVMLGVDLTNYYPVDKVEARQRCGVEVLKDKFIVGNVNRNQPRKRWDLTIRYVALWAKSRNIEDNVWLYLHTAPTGDFAGDANQLAKYYGLNVALLRPPTFYGVTEDRMRDTYGCFDVQVSTTQGEGFGLTTFEGMACGVPQIVPDWSALGELTRGAAMLVPCTSTAVGVPYVGVIGGVPDEAKFIEALDTLYYSKNACAAVRDLGLRRVNEERFRWKNVGTGFLNAVDLVVPYREPSNVRQFAKAEVKQLEVTA